MSSKEIRVPDIGDFSDVDVIEVLVNPGDSVAVDDALITLESDKASMDVPSPEAGTVQEVKVKVGDKVSEGDLVALLEAGSEAAESAPAPSPAPTSGGGSEAVKVPDIGDFSDVDVIDVLVSPGDSVAVDDALITLESDKASMDVPSPAAGTVQEVKVKVGDKVSEGDVILMLEGSGGAPAPAPSTDAGSKSTAPAPAPAPSAAAEAGVSFGRVHASPSVRRLARERKIDLNQVKGSGRKGRITKDDLEAFEKGQARRWISPSLARSRASR